MSVAATEPDFSELGPATRLAIRLGLKACDDSIRLIEEKQTFRALSAEERFELHCWQQARHQLLTQHYPPPYGTRPAAGVEVDPVV